MTVHHVGEDRSEYIKQPAIVDRYPSHDGRGSGVPGYGSLTVSGSFSATGVNIRER